MDINQFLRLSKPTIVGWIREIAATPGAVSNVVNVEITAVPHAIDDPSWHSGVLSEDQAPWALLADGTRQLTGNLSVAEFATIDGVDLDLHALNADAHHSQDHALVGPDHNATGLTAGWTVRATGADTFAWAQLQHGDIGGVTANQHHNQVHNIVGTDHTISASQFQLVGASGVNVLGLLTPAYEWGGAPAILRSSAAGDLSLPTFTATTRMRTPLVDTVGVPLTLQPATDVILQPGSNIVRLMSGRVIQSDGYASQTTGMRVSHAGEGDFRYLFADEMHVKSFVADLEQALAGGQIISKSVAVLALNFALPAAGATGTLRVRDLPSAPNMAVFQSGDYIGLRQFSRASGSLTVGWAWGTVTSYTDQSDGTQTWTFTRHASTPGAASGTIAADSLVLDFGVTGNGFYEINAIDGAYGANSPYWRIVTWATHPATQTVRVQGGNLRGLFGVADEFGLYAGTGTGTSDAHLRLSNNISLLQNIPIEMYVSGTKHISINPSYGIDIRIAETEQSYLSWRSTIGTGSPLAALAVVNSTSVGPLIYANINDVNKEAYVSIAAVNQAYSPNSVSLTLRRGSVYPSLARLNANVIEFWQSGGSGTPTFTAGGNTVWHAGNDGAGTGLDADLLDGAQGSLYARLDTTQTITGAWTFNGNPTLGGHMFRNMYSTNDIYDHYYPVGGNGANYSAINMRVWNGAGSFRTFRFAGNNSITWEGNTIWHAGNDGSGSGLDADLLRGLGLASASQKWNVILYCGSDGVMEVGRYLDFHETSGDTSDYSARIWSTGGSLYTSGHLVGGGILSAATYMQSAAITPPAATAGWVKIALRSSDNALVAVMPSGNVRVLATN